jgi:hypothetical protein
LTELALKACFFDPSLPRDPSIFPERRSVVKALLAGCGWLACRWPYSLELRDSLAFSESFQVRGKLQRHRERITVHGLNDNHNKRSEESFPSPLHDFYVARVEKGMRR